MNPEKRKALMLSHFGKTNKDLEEDVKLIKEWLKTQPHLPEIPSDHMIASFIWINKFSLEKTKQRIDLYYTNRSTMPYVFQFANPKSQFMKTSAESRYLHFFLCLYFLSTKQNIDYTSKNPYIFFPRNKVKLYFFFQKLLNSRIKQFHFFNCPSYVDLLFKLCKQFLKPKLYERIRIHKSTDTLLDYIPAEVLPSDYGGKEKSVEELQKDWNAKLAEYQEVFDQRDGLKVNESLRPTPLENAEAYGVQGTFKNLSVD
uniref:Uncharacterized protein LOC114342716 n=1 Tax=Diabrotica virgifera virgifera TaxID=50390 RepID=A0A6P7GHK6_DIAVI